MKVTLEKQGQNLVQMALEVEAGRAQKAYDVACRELSHKVNIPGFRRGKAPKNIVEKTIGVDYIKQEALEHLVPELLNKAITEENLDIITQPSVESCHFELGEELKLTAKFEVRPDVTLGNYIGVSVEVPQAAMKPDAIEHVLKQLAETKSSLTEIDARAIVMNDTVVLDFECHFEGKLIEGGKAEGLMLEMKPGNFFDGFCEQLIGLKPADKKDVNVKFPDDYRNKDLSGKDAIFKVVIGGLRERVIPDITDELAKSFGYESKTDLEDAVKVRLESEVKEENDSRAQKEVVNAVVALTEVDIPETMIERECQILIDNTKRTFERSGENYEQFAESDKFAEFHEQKMKEARERVHTSLTLGAIVRAEKITVSDEEVAPHLYELAQYYKTPIEKLVQNPDLTRKVMEDVLAEKVVKFLLERSKVSYVEDKSAQAALETATAKV